MGFSALLLPNCPGVGALGGNLGSSSSWIQGIKAPDLLTWSQRPLRWLCCGVRTGAVQIGQAVTELTCLVSKRRSLSFNHNSGLQPGPSDSCCLRPSSCVFRVAIPHTLAVVYFSYCVRGLPTGLAILIPPLISTRPFYLWPSGPARPSLLSTAQTSWQVLLRCCWAP